jgi:hypothetical protein
MLRFHLAAIGGSDVFGDHPIRVDEMRALRKLRRDYPKDPMCFVSERGGPITPPEWLYVTASRGCSILGLGTASQRISPLPCHANAFTETLRT